MLVGSDWWVENPPYGSPPTVRTPNTPITPHPVKPSLCTTGKTVPRLAKAIMHGDRPETERSTIGGLKNPRLAYTASAGPPFLLSQPWLQANTLPRIALVRGEAAPPALSCQKYLKRSRQKRAKVSGKSSTAPRYQRTTARRSSSSIQDTFAGGMACVAPDCM